MALDKLLRLVESVSPTAFLNNGTYIIGLRGLKELTQEGA